MKKLLVLLLSFVIVFSSAAVFAEDVVTTAVEEVSDARTEYPVSPLNLGEYMDKDAWMSAVEGVEFSLKDGKVISESEILNVIGTRSEDFSDALVQFNAKFSFEGLAGFSIRENYCGEKIWAVPSNAYLFIIKSDRIELQRYTNGVAVILDVVPNECVKQGEEVEISAAAVNTEAGVGVFLFVDGVCVINVCDTGENAVKKGDCVNFYAPKGTEISAYTGDIIPSVPTAPVITVENEGEYKFTADYDLVSFGGETEDTYSLNWGFSTNKEGENLTELDKAAKDEFGATYALIAEFETLDVADSEIEPTLEQANGYLISRVLDADGNVLATSTSEKIEGSVVLENEANKLLDGSVALVVDYETAFVNGEKTQIDKNDSNVMPTVIKGRTLVPVRFIAESFNANVGWDDATQKVTIELDGKTIVMTLNETVYTVDGEEKQLDVPATTIYDRTMVPVRAISEAFSKEVFWEEENELIIISSEDLGINLEEDMSILNYIAKQIR